MQFSLAKVFEMRNYTKKKDQRKRGEGIVFDDIPYLTDIKQCKKPLLIGMLNNQDLI